MWILPSLSKNHTFIKFHFSIALGNIYIYKLMATSMYNEHTFISSWHIRLLNRQTYFSSKKWMERRNTTTTTTNKKNYFHKVNLNIERLSSHSNVVYEHIFDIFHRLSFHVFGILYVYEKPLSSWSCIYINLMWLQKPNIKWSICMES